jgi:2-polyprenyl-3-methyl-5-hydroxy-6-metoxy-1,4-benzoquinol methylase
MATTPWQKATGARGEDYDAKFSVLERRGQSVHGEADFVASFGVHSVLDAGCGTGRVTIELARRGIAVSGVDREADMLRVARRKAPHLDWHLADLSTVRLENPGTEGQLRLFEAIVLAGNVMIFLDTGTESAVIANLARHIRPGGLLIAGFQLQQGLELAVYDVLAEQSGLQLKERWATWDRQPWHERCGYAVSVHQRPA